MYFQISNHHLNKDAQISRLTKDFSILNLRVSLSSNLPVSALSPRLRSSAELSDSTHDEQVGFTTPNKSPDSITLPVFVSVTER